MIAPSQGVHIVLPREFLPRDTAIMVPHTRDGRVMFAIPWHGHAIALGRLEERPCLTRDLRIHDPGKREESAARFVCHEMARTVEDVLARRTRLLFLNARAALAQAPAVAEEIAQALGRDRAWQEAQMTQFAATARCYLPPPS